MLSGVHICTVYSLLLSWTRRNHFNIHNNINILPREWAIINIFRVELPSVLFLGKENGKCTNPLPKKYPPKNVEKLNTVHRPVSNHNTESWLQRIIMITNISQHSPSQYWELFYKLRPSSPFVQLSDLPLACIRECGVQLILLYNMLLCSHFLLVNCHG